MFASHHVTKTERSLPGHWEGLPPIHTTGGGRIGLYFLFIVLNDLCSFSNSGKQCIGDAREEQRELGSTRRRGRRARQGRRRNENMSVVWQ